MFLKMKLLGKSQPARAHKDDAGLDLCSRVTKRLEHNEIARIPLGAAVAIPADHMGLLVPRSSLLEKKGLYGQTGIIDAGYRGELQAVIKNVSGKRHTIWEEDRIYQLVLVPITIPDGVTFGETLDGTDRSNGGFGSTGGYA